MTEIKWCKAQNKGIKLVEPNDNLAKEYIQTAEETLEVLKSLEGKSKVWLATTKYYCEYFAIYSLLMRIGIKCEIHECTIAVCGILEKQNLLPKGYTKVLDEDKKLRIDNQYYLKNRDVPIDYNQMVDFVLKTKNISVNLTKDEINKIRKIIECA
ncbi:MAG: hypothetical protein Q8O89_05945 [Nanoarchaeota archaeon]|nr:hypothetical protein [Nanoarchaeota archaeon]